MDFYWKDGIPFIYQQKSDLGRYVYWFEGSPFLTTPSTGTLTQYMFPIADVSGSWTQSPLYSKVNEYYADDLNYIQSQPVPVNNGTELLLGTAGNIPSSLTGHVLRYRYEKNMNSSTGINLTIGLYQGNTLIKEATHSNLQKGWVDGVMTLTTGEAATITNYTNLRVRLIAITG